MNYIKDTFARMDLRQIRQFILYGTEELNSEKQGYDHRLKTGSDPIYDRLKSLYPDGKEFDKAAADLAQALSAFESVYMEMGMKAGARLVHQLLFTDNETPAGTSCRKSEGADING